VLVEGKAIQIHPLVCTAFNADFDGDQMAVHLPLSAEAQAEARILMLSAHNILSPAHGRPITVPTQDMIIGAYYLTETDEGHGGGRTFSSLDEAVLAYDERLAPGTPLEERLSLHVKIKVRMPGSRFPAADYPERDDAHPDAMVLRRNGDNGDSSVLVESTLGRFLFNEAFPVDFPFHDAPVKKRDLTELASLLVERYPRAVVAESLDKLKDIGFEFATRSGLTISIADVKTPASKAELLEHFEAEADKVEGQYERGVITDDERRQKEIEVWSEATAKVRDAMQAEMRQEKFNPIDMMVGSGARGNVMQVQQIAGMRGLVANPRGEIIPRPIKSNFREGLSVLEYFISTHGARKGLADTALRTADSGYLTRRLVDVAQEVIVREDDCESTRGIWIENVDGDTESIRILETKLLGRLLTDDVSLSDGTVMPRNTEVGEAEVRVLGNDPAVSRVRVRSVLTCDSIDGICQLCYGTMLATNLLVENGEAVGIIAAQSIGEPGTQLTMRTFHTGGVAGEDITHGLPRVVELFEARTPKSYVGLASASGVARISETERGEQVLTVVTDAGDEVVQDPNTYSTQRHTFYPLLRDGVEVVVGDPILTTQRNPRVYTTVRGIDESSEVYAEDLPRNPKELLDLVGIRATQQYLVEQVQRVYKEQGVSIHDKHVEVIVRQMLRKVAVSEPGDSNFLPGERVDARKFADENRRLVEDGKQPAEGRPELMGITKASLATDSWLSAASFQETTRVLTEAAIEGRSDSLFGLKENVIIGKLIPAGTGMLEYREIDTEAPDYEPLPFYSSEVDDFDGAEWLRNLSSDQVSADEAYSAGLSLVPDAEVVEVDVIEDTGTA
jgi:DNA-directed RNA polymerase subunit beta'